MEETSTGSLTWTAHRDEPPLGRWTAFFVDLQFDGPKSTNQIGPNSKPNSKAWRIGEDGVYVFTTEASIVPNTFPYPTCSGVGCFGKLV